MGTEAVVNDLNKYYSSQDEPLIMTQNEPNLMALKVIVCVVSIMSSSGSQGTFQWSCIGGSDLM